MKRLRSFLHRSCDVRHTTLQLELEAKSEYIAVILEQWDAYHRETQDHLVRRIDSKVFDNLTSIEYKLELVGESSNSLSLKLNELWLRYGSDKGLRHGYEKFYSSIPFNACEANCVLEIGIGTNVINAPSSMGIDGSPGASLLTWKSILPEHIIYGADIEPKAIQEARDLGFEKIYILDQTSKKSWDEMLSQIKDTKFALIVDDGLHESYSAYISLIHGWTLLAKNGVYVIEDVPEEHFKLWIFLWETDKLPSRPHFYFNTSKLSEYSFDSGIVWFVK